MSRIPIIAWLYALFATLALGLVALTMPPFQNADELNHALRADQISHLGLLARTLPGGDHGGWVDFGLETANHPFENVPFDTAAKVTRSKYRPQGWGTLSPVAFPNTAIYPPVFYIPQAIAIFVARRLHFSVLHGLTLARIASGTVAVGLAMIALFTTEAGSLWIFAILLLPMSLALCAALSQDAIMLSCTALACVLVQRLKIRPSVALFWLAALLLALIAMARPPYAGFALALLAVRLPLRVRLAGVAAVVIAAAGWSASMARHIVLPIFSGIAINPQAQLHLLLASPFRAITVASATWHRDGRPLLQQFIGRPGWLDVDLPQSYFPAAWCILILAALISVWRCNWRQARPADMLPLVGICTAILGMGLIEYLTWTIPGAPCVDGLQGRYFLPPALMLVACLPGERPGQRLQPGLTWIVMLFPLVSLPTLLHALLIRYYI